MKRVKTGTRNVIHGLRLPGPVSLGFVTTVCGKRIERDPRYLTKESVTCKRCQELGS